MFKNISGQKLRVFAFDTSTNTPKTGDALNITCKVSKDNAAPVALTDVNPVEVEDGYYLFDLSQEETNADVLDFYPESSTSNIAIIVPNYDRQTVRSVSILAGSVSSGFEEIIILLRSLVQDLDGSIYSDASLSRLIITSSILVQQEVYFEQSYTIDISLVTIDPDPTDNVFKLFVAHKAAIILIQSEIRKYASQTMKIVDGPSTIDVSSQSKEYKVLLDSLTAQYNRMKLDYTISGNFGYAVLTPTTVEYISPSEFS